MGKKMIKEFFSIFFLAVIFIFGVFGNVGAATLTVDDSGESIQAAIDNASNGDTINIAAGTYVETLNLQEKSLIINGAGVGDTIIDASSFTGYGIKNFGDSSVVRDLKLIGTTDSYGFKVSHVSDIALENIEVENSYRTGIDLNTVDDATLSNIKITGTDWGFGLMIFNSNDVTVTNVETSANEWAGVTVQTKGETSDNINFVGEFNATDVFPFLLEKDPDEHDNYYEITNLQIPSLLIYVVDVFREGNDYKQKYYFEDLDYAKMMALNFVNSSSPVYSDVLIYDISKGDYYVEEGMFIQNAINLAESEDTINVGAGVYEEHLEIKKSLTLSTESNAEITKGIGIFSDDVIVSGFKISTCTEIVCDNSGIYFHNSGLNNIKITNNEITNNSLSSSPRGISFAISGNYTDVEVINNTIHDVITGIYTNPHEGIITIENNEIYNTVAGIGGLTGANVRFNSFYNNSEAIGADSSLENYVLSDNKFINSPVKNYGAIVVNALKNYWDTNNKSEIQTLISGDVDYSPWFSDEEMNSLYFSEEVSLPDENGTVEMTLEDEINLTTEIIIANQTKYIEVSIPSNVTISVDDSNWTGAINTPVIKESSSVDFSTTSLKRNVSRIVEVGLPDTKLTFSKAVKILIPQETGKKVGYSHGGGDLTQISTLCSYENNQTWADENLEESGDCYYDNGQDIIIWTKHFTQFVTYDETPISSGGGSSGGGGGSGGGHSGTTIISQEPEDEASNEVQGAAGLPSSEISKAEDKSFFTTITGAVTGGVGKVNTLAVLIFLVIILTVLIVLMIRKRNKR